MTQQRSLERQIADWMADEAVGPAPDHLTERIDVAVDRAGQAPRWLAVLKEPAMTSLDRTVVSVPRRPLILVAILAMLAAALTIGAAAFLLRPSPDQENWPGYRGDAERTGLAATAPVGRPVTRWHISAGGAVRGAIAISGDTVVFGSDDGVLHGVAVDTGRGRWSVPMPGVLENLFVADDRVYATSGDGFIHALRLTDGGEIWKSASTFPGSTYLVTVGTRLFTGTHDGDVVALETSTGREVWRTTISETGSAVRAPAVTDATMVAATDDGSLTALDPTTGDVQWQVDTGQVAVGNPTISDGLAYLGGSPDTAGGSLVAYHLRDGTPAWHVDRDVYAPSIADRVGYTGSGSGTVAAIDLANGEEQWVASFGGTVRAPVVAGDVVYVSADGERRIAMLDRATGGELASFPLDGQNQCCLAAARGLLFVGTLAGSVYAIGGDGAALTPKAVAPSTSTQGTTTAATTRPKASETAPPLATDLIWSSTSPAADFDPWGLTLAPDRRLWVMESPNDRISIFASDGTFVESWGESGSGDGQFDLTRGNGDPYGAVAFAPDGSFYVLDVGNRRVQHFKADRTFINAWGSFGAGPGQFNDPVGLVVDEAGTVFVLDDIRNVIESYAPDGEVIGSIAAFPDGMQNDGANRLSLGPDGNFLVSMAGPTQVLELTPQGRIVRIFGAPGTDGALGEQPNAVAFDAAGHVYISQGRNRTGRGVMVYEPDGTFLGSFGEAGGGKDQLAFPWGMLVLDDGIVISDPGELFDGSNLLRKFAPVTIP